MIKLVELELKNFKGIKQLKFEFEDETIITGDNATGKTTIFDAFNYLFFGKNSENRKDFEIQTLDENNNIIHNQELYVQGIINVDGNIKKLKRCLNEKWQKPRGQAFKELKGTVTTYEIDDIPVKLKEFQSFIDSLIDEDIFKMVTNPFQFNSINWVKRREILLDIIGNVDDNLIIDSNKELDKLKELLTDGVENLQKRTQYSIKKLKEQVKSIPYRIDECYNSITEINIEELKSNKERIEKEINNIDIELNSSNSQNTAQNKLEIELLDISNKISIERNKALNLVQKANNDRLKKLNEKESQYNEFNYDIKNIENSVKYLTNDLEKTRKSIEVNSFKRKELLEQYHNCNEEVFKFDNDLSYCKACGREYDLNKVEEIKANALKKFNEYKEKTLAAIVKDGKFYAELLKNNIETEAQLINDIEDLNKRKSIIQVHLVQAKLEYEELKSISSIIAVDPTELELELNNRKSEIENKLKDLKNNEVDNSDLIFRKKILKGDLDNCNKKLGLEDKNKELQKRIDQLNIEERDLQNNIAELEGHLYLCDEFIRTKVNLLEERINSIFEGQVQFKLFKNLVNGGLEECCETLINGVPFTDANYAAKVNAGLSIINTLCKYYHVNAPIFVDNCESINDIIVTESQIIKLKVSNDKIMKVEGLNYGK